MAGTTVNLDAFVVHLPSSSQKTEKITQKVKKVSNYLLMGIYFIHCNALPP